MALLPVQKLNIHFQSFTSHAFLKCLAVCNVLSFWWNQDVLGTRYAIEGDNVVERTVLLATLLTPS